ncbi:hypothetical protein [Alkalihalobacillus hemicellulosilyticus]|nr:hypothetical protein [Halalkalibacter hemicellulosilyticus]
MNQVKQKKTKAVKNEKKSRREWQELMGANRPTYSRRRGSLRQR